MTRTSILLAVLTLAVPTLSSSNAVAGRGSGARATRTTTPRARTRVRTTPSGQNRNSARRVQSAAAAKQYQKAVARVVKEMKSLVWDQAGASYTEAVFKPSVTVKVLRQDAYDPGKGVNQSKLLKVSGPGIDSKGSVELTVLNNVSAHDLYHDGMSESQFQRNVNNRIAGDLMRVSVRYPNGQTVVIKDMIPTKDVTAVPLTIKLQKGVNEIRVDRLNKQGMVVGSAGMLGGRRVEVQWDGN